MNVLVKLCKLSATGAVLTVAVGCSTTPDYAAPSVFTVSNNAVTLVVQEALAHTAGAAQVEGSATVNCSGETSCTIAVSAAVKTVDGNAEKSALFTLSCDPGAAVQINRNHVDAKGLKTFCNYTPQATDR